MRRRVIPYILALVLRLHACTCKLFSFCAHRQADCMHLLSAILTLHTQGQAGPAQVTCMRLLLIILMLHGAPACRSQTAGAPGSSRSPAPRGWGRRPAASACGEEGAGKQGIKKLRVHIG